VKITGTVMGIVAISFGVLVIAFPNIIQWLLGIYLIVAGILAIIGRR